MRALVVGGGGGLGRAICSKLAADGYEVVATYRSNPPADVRAEKMALEDAESVRAVVDAIAPFDVVVQAAGAAIRQPYLSQVTVEAWREVVDAEVHGFFHLVQAALPHLRRSRGALVAVTSVGLLRYPPRDVLSVAPKAAVAALVAALAREEGRYGVRANCVAPGVIEAGIFLRLREGEFDAATLEAMRRATPLGRFGAAEDVAEAVAFLASPRAGFITGQTLAVDGGYSV